MRYINNLINVILTLISNKMSEEQCLKAVSLFKGHWISIFFEGAVLEKRGEFDSLQTKSIKEMLLG